MEQSLIYSSDFDESEMPIEIGDLNGLFNRSPLIEADGLPVCLQLRLKRYHDFMSQAQLATHLKMGVSTLSDYESGKRDIAKKHWSAIYSYLYREYFCGGVLTDIFDLDGNEMIRNAY